MSPAGTVRSACLLALVLALAAPCPSAAQSTATPEPAARDPFTAALAAAGLDAGDLGLRPKSYWARYPNLGLIPYRPILFDDLFAEPMRLHDVVRIMALAARDYLDPRYDAAAAGPLYKLAYFVGFEKKVGGFRNYGFTQTAVPDEQEPLVRAVQAAFERRGRQFHYTVMGKPADWPRREEAVRRAVAPLHPGLRRALGKAVLELVEARRWVDMAFRKVDREDLARVWQIRDLTETQFDAMEYFPEVDDVARALDEASLYYAGMRTLQAAEGLKRDLEALLRAESGVDWGAAHLELETPMGRLLLGGTGDDRHDARDAFLVVDLGGNDAYVGPAGATSSPFVPVAVCVDLAGNDRYVNRDRMMPAQGAAVCGAGVLLDVSGDDVYESRCLAQGAGQFGTGILADLAGDDRYIMEVAGQGCGLFGVGLLVDAGGTDRYRLHGDGQGYGGVGGGVGTLVDVAGDDSYFAEPDASQVARGDYHGGGEINYSYAQGVGIGRRGDISDGHSWAGGTGTLIDLAGNDRYKSGTWSLGCSYWYGIGLFWDEAGDDVYESCAWSLGSGAHFGISAFFDQAGDDRYLGYRNASQCLGFGHDYVIALFVDRGGDDTYVARACALGYAQRMSQAFFLDLGGQDRYTGAADSCFGRTDYPHRLARPKLEFTYEIYARQVALFLDVGGADEYGMVQGGKPTAEIQSVAADRNDQQALVPAEAADRDRFRHHGIFVDRELLGAPPIPWLADRFSSLHER
ncbi:MAG: hypothetical protein JXQ29_17860 [Planctomycetes bacterium]|nr:hypothetical protein [Planctomycetota bacterium]